MPRKLKRRKPRCSLTCPKTNSTIALRILYTARPAAVRNFELSATRQEAVDRRLSPPRRYACRGPPQQQPGRTLTMLPQLENNIELSSLARAGSCCLPALLPCPVRGDLAAVSSLSPATVLAAFTQAGGNLQCEFSRDFLLFFLSLHWHSDSCIAQRAENESGSTGACNANWSQLRLTG